MSITRAQLIRAVALALAIHDSAVTAVGNDIPAEVEPEEDEDDGLDE